METQFQIITKAIDKRTNEVLVIYQEMVSPFTIYALTQEDFDKLTKTATVSSVREIEETEEIEGVDKDFIRFLDATSYHDKIDIFLAMGERLDNHMLNNMAATLDVTLVDDEDAYECILQNLRMRERFELRR